MILNLNIGVLGHVDSGKTTLAKAISETASTAAFDKNPQSQERGITLDLGFSSYLCDLPDHLLNNSARKYEKLQFTFVDCPGHAKLIKTIIGGAQIIDIMILVIDIKKGIQTQTAECLVIGELTCDHLIIVLNKIDLLELDKREKSIEKMTKKLKAILSDTKFHNAAIHPLSATTNEYVTEFIEILKEKSFIPKRNTENQPFLFAVDHCFSIKGQGTVCTGTVLQGSCKIGDTIEFPMLKLNKKIKSIQMFRTALQAANQGDRIGICVTQFDPKLLERGLIAQPDYVSHTQIAIIRLNIIKYYKLAIKSKSKFHINIGHETVMAKCTLFTSKNPDFDIKDEYEYLEEHSQWAELPENKNIFCLLEFEQSISIVPGSLLIGAKLDMDANTTQCRIAFWGTIQSKQSDISLDKIRIYKIKTKEGHVQRVIDDYAVIVDHMFKRESNRGMFLGQPVTLSTGECGTLECWFGYTTKVKVNIPKGLLDTTKEKIKQNQMKSIVATMKYKKFLHAKSIG